MRNTYIVDSGVQKGTSITFLLTEKPTTEQVKPAGQLITDSDAHSFVYLLDEQDGYGYVQFPKNVWGLLTELLRIEEDPSLEFGDQTFVLHQFREELEMLLYNIEGNENYGADFTKEVETIFQDFYENA
ncbi:hypothetical protein [Paenisporosarcina cavernae]|uniref:Uncharacterized protein n=1 Tax=Paenisporosarcina cavernae TaxID=2320858 RepID=A0A385YRA9_9BACL|nr:hypothetical protein [Paenisporosarcina cavernae]AYC29024.1 hypothetical protein D3873_03725 [Paenisporosarcina cavernae]